MRREPPTTHVVSTFPPARDGIARYADQLSADLATRERVDRIGLGAGQGDRGYELTGGVRPLRLLRASARGDRLVIMWHPSLYLRGGGARRTLTYLAFGVVLRRRPTTIVVHEPEPELATAGPRVRRAVERRARRWAWAGANAIELHSERERAAYLAEVGTGLRARTTVREHHAAFMPAATTDRAEARRRLGLPPGHVFLCIGFIGAHKGFDRAVEAFDGLATAGARLYLVGSVLEGHPDGAGHLAALRRLTTDRPGVELREGYVSDEDFDVWIRAADTVLLPYRAIGSSSVVGRARLLGTPVVVTDVGALPEQIGPDDTVVRSDAQLRAVMAARATR